MKGTLHKTEQGWVVRFSNPKEYLEPLHYLPLHPEDESLSYAVRDSAWEGKKVEFEIVNIWETNTNTDRKLPTLDDFKRYAKLIPSGELEFTKTGKKESQKELIKEIMELNDRDGFYKDDVWELGLEDELNKLPYTKHLDDGQYNDGQLLGFELGAKWGYNKAKETLYTEEQVKEIVEKSRETGLTAEYLMLSLKQPK